MAERIALWGRDIDDDSSPDPDSGSAGDGHHDPITEPIPVVEDESCGYGNGYTDSNAYTDAEPEYVDDLTDNADTQETAGAFSYAKPFLDRRPGSPADSLTFKPAPSPWYRTRRGLIVLLAVIAVAVLLALLPLLMRGPGPQAPTNTPSTEPTPSSVQPTSTSGAPELTSQPAPPPPPPPPPPPAPDAPVYRPQYPSSGGGSGSRAPKPEIGVTRAPISVAPKPVTPPTSAEVGKHGSTSRW